MSASCLAIGAALLADPLVEYFVARGTEEDALVFWGIASTVVGLVISVPTFIGTVRRGEALSELEADNQELREALDAVYGDVLAFADSQVKAASVDLNFGLIPGVHERITIYSHDRKGFFTAFGRFSQNPQYRRKSKRAQYEEDAGCIGAAWEDKWYFRADYPDPSQNVEAWVARCREVGMEDDVARRINMKSRLYCGCRIDSRDNDPIAVVVVESTDPECYIEGDLREFFGVWSERLREPLERLTLSLPRAATAREAGF